MRTSAVYSIAVFALWLLATNSHAQTESPARNELLVEALDESRIARSTAERMQVAHTNTGQILFPNGNTVEIDTAIFTVDGSRSDHAQFLKNIESMGKTAREYFHKIASTNPSVSNFAIVLQPGENGRISPSYANGDILREFALDMGGKIEGTVSLDVRSMNEAPADLQRRMAGLESQLPEGTRIVSIPISPRSMEQWTDRQKADRLDLKKSGIAVFRGILNGSMAFSGFVLIPAAIGATGVVMAEAIGMSITAGAMSLGLGLATIPLGTYVANRVLAPEKNKYKRSNVFSAIGKVGTIVGPYIFMTILAQTAIQTAYSGTPVDGLQSIFSQAGELGSIFADYWKQNFNLKSWFMATALGAFTEGLGETLIFQKNAEYQGRTPDPKKQASAWTKTFWAITIWGAANTLGYLVAGMETMPVVSQMGTFGLYAMAGAAFAWDLVSGKNIQRSFAELGQILQRGKDKLPSIVYATNPAQIRPGNRCQKAILQVPGLSL